jgi:hypothetical protein
MCVWESSMLILQPCMQLDPTLSCEFWQHADSLSVTGSDKVWPMTLRKKQHALRFNYTISPLYNKLHQSWNLVPKSLHKKLTFKLYFLTKLLPLQWHMERPYFGGIMPYHPASSPLCDSMLVEIKCINVRRNTTVFSNCWRKQLHVSGPFQGGPSSGWD